MVNTGVVVIGLQNKSTSFSSEDDRFAPLHIHLTPCTLTALSPKPTAHPMLHNNLITRVVTVITQLMLALFHFVTNVSTHVDM